MYNFMSWGFCTSICVTITLINYIEYFHHPPKVTLCPFQALRPPLRDTTVLIFLFLNFI